MELIIHSRHYFTNHELNQVHNSEWVFPFHYAIVFPVGQTGQCSGSHPI